MERTAFCPGHVTGFFEICRSDDILSTGSRGAGLCLSLGATSKVAIEEEPRQKVAVRIVGSDSRGEVSREAVKHLIGDLPMRQGFGMSAAGSLSAALAVADILGLPRQKAFEAAHVAEVQCSSGLGDVSAIHCGGIAIRKRAGLPPTGETMRVEGAPEVVLAVVGRGIRTKAVLTDPEKTKLINASGSRKVDELVEEPSVERLMRLSAEFARETGLASKQVLRAMEDTRTAGTASMSMLGSSVFAVGDTPSLACVLSDLGTVWTCSVDTKGPRTIENKS